MRIKKQFYGVIPPVPTILFKNGHIDEVGFGRLIDFLINSKVDGLFFLGSGGEFGQMSIELRKQVAEFATKYINGRVPVLIGTGYPGTKETIELSLHAKEVGADGVVVINPYYYNLTEDSLFQHFAEVAKNVDLPIILYNYPDLTGQDLSPNFVLKLVEKYSNVIGIKDTVKDVGHTREMIQIVKSEHPDFSVFSGFDDHFLNTLSLGGDGSIPLTASFVPELSIGIYQAFKQGDYRQAIHFHQKLAPFLGLYKLDTPFMNVAKEAIRFRGIEVSTEMLAPVLPLSEEKKEKLKSFLKKELYLLNGYS